jgi:Uma2 family endonuclease
LPGKLAAVCFEEAVVSKIRFPEFQRLILEGESWSSYIRLLRNFDERRRLFITYHRGLLEITTSTFQRECLAGIMAWLISAWTEEGLLAIRGGRSTNFRRRDRLCGLEPDQCFWIAHEAQVRGLNQIDLRRDPPPDLIVDIALVHGCVPRLPIYAAFGMPEVWRIGKGGLSFHVLQPDRKYARAPVSSVLPPLKPADLEPYLVFPNQLDETTLIRKFRDWVRQQPTP